MTILHYILIALEVVLIFNLIIGVHELGHFLAARWRGTLAGNPRRLQTIRFRFCIAREFR